MFYFLPNRECPFEVKSFCFMSSCMVGWKDENERHLIVLVREGKRKRGSAYLFFYPITSTLRGPWVCVPAQDGWKETQRGVCRIPRLAVGVRKIIKKTRMSTNSFWLTKKRIPKCKKDRGDEKHSLHCILDWWDGDGSELHHAYYLFALIKIPASSGETLSPAKSTGGYVFGRSHGK